MQKPVPESEAPPAVDDVETDAETEEAEDDVWAKLEAQQATRRCERLNLMMQDIVEAVPGLAAAEVFFLQTEGGAFARTSTSQSIPRVFSMRSSATQSLSTTKLSPPHSPTKQSQVGDRRGSMSSADPERPQPAAKRSAHSVGGGSVLVRPEGGWYCKMLEEGAVLQFKEEDAGEAIPAVSFAGILFGEASGGSALHWRLLKTMAEDPEIPHDERTQLAARVFGSVGAAALPRQSGILLLYTSGDGNKVLRASQTTEFVRAATADIAAFAATWEPRHALALASCQSGQRMVGEWERITEALMKKRGVKAPSVMEVLIGDLSENLHSDKRRRRGGLRLADCVQKFKDMACSPWLAGYAKKCKGAGGKVPPRGDWNATAWTFAGVFVTLMIMSSLSKFLVAELTDGEYFLMLGSFGALLTLLFGAPASPLCQPRNMIFGTTYSATVAILVRYLSAPEYLDFLPKWIASALVPAIAIAGMAKLGILHPPAGAASLIFISGGPKITNLGWFYVLLPLFVGNVICLVMATLINNLNAKRQYPLFW